MDEIPGITQALQGDHYLDYQRREDTARIPRLHGPAGIGKSSITHTIAYQSREPIGG